MRKLVFGSIFLICPSLSWASDVAGTTPPSTSSVKSLPTCYEDKEVKALFDELKRVPKEQKDQMKAKYTEIYENYKKTLNKESDNDLIARLAYAETMAAKCPGHEREIAAMADEVIQNRVVRKKGNVRDVVFGQMQFASSLHYYPESDPTHFMCPKDEKLWSYVSNTVRRQRSPSDLTHYYLFQHFAREVRPKNHWSYIYPSGRTISDANGKPCITDYHNPKWPGG